MAEPKSFGEEVGAVVGGKPHGIGLLRVLLHSNGELVAARRLHRRHYTDELAVRPLTQTSNSDRDGHETLKPETETRCL